MLNDIQEVLSAMTTEFNLGTFEIEDLKTQIEHEGIRLHVCRYVLSKLIEQKKGGRTINSPKGLFVSLMRQYRDMPEEVTKTVKQPDMHDEGFDFSFGDRQESENICRKNFWLSETDDPHYVQRAREILHKCAPILQSDELDTVFDVMHDFDYKYGIMGPYPMRLKNAVWYVLSHRTTKP